MLSSVEILGYLKRQLGIITNRLEEVGVIVNPYDDHVFRPSLTVTDQGTVLEVNGLVHRISVAPDSAPVKFNLDRPVTDTEYSVVFPGTIKVISRRAQNVYLKAPLGSTSTVTVECLRMVS